MKATVSKELLLEALRRDLHLSEKVDILLVVEANLQPKNMTRDYWVKCIDDSELENYEATVANASDSNSARTTYKSDPKPLYAIVNVDSINNKSKARIMPKEVSQAAKNQKLMRLQIVQTI